MLEKKDRQRCFSAKTPTRTRPSSGILNVNRISTDIKTQMITSIYNGKQKSPPKRNNSAKKIFYQGISSQQLTKFKKTISKNVTKSKEEIYEQNLHLKQQINKLKQQQAITKGKLQTKSKKVLSKNKQLDMQFEKEIYWAGTKTHMVQGVKYQYQKLKKQNVQNKAKINELNVQLYESKLPEYKIYAESVQMENKRLSEELQKLNLIIKNSLRPNHQNQSLVKDLLLAETDAQNLQLKKQIQKLDQQLKKIKQQIKTRNKKIQFLEKLLVEKGNNQYHLQRKYKKSQKQKQQMDSYNKQLQQTIQNKNKQNEVQIKQLKESFSREIQITNIKFNSQLKQKNAKISHLQDENKHLQNTIHKLRMQSSVTHNESNNLVTNRTIRRDSIVYDNKAGRDTQINKSRKIDNYESILSKNQQEQEQQDQNQHQRHHSKFRVRKRADKKHSQSSKRVRKVQYNQVQQIGEIIKYRFINLEIQPNKIRNYFTCKSSGELQKSRQNQSFLMQQQNRRSQQLSVSQRANEWDQEYISMRQCIQILSEFPFSLDEESAFLLSRYIIEDCHQQYVYCDYANENNRNIVKSIIKSVIGEYTVPTKQSKEAAKEFMDNYQTNLQSALRTYYPNGKVIKRKFLDTLNGLGVGVSQQIQEILLAKAANKSKNLQQLEYNYLFIKQAK